MAVELKVPAVGESITEVRIAAWFKAPGDRVERDEPLVELESDKATIELPAPEAGILAEIRKGAGATASIGEVIGLLAGPGEAAAPPAPPGPAGRVESFVMPAAARALAEHGMDAASAVPTGPGGRLLKEDVEHAASSLPAAGGGGGGGASAPGLPPGRGSGPGGEPGAAATPQPPPPAGREERAVPMSPLRRRVAERLVQAQQTAALLTTFNEVDMGEVLRLRREHQDAFQAKHGVKLGLMSFFVKAAVEALREVPQLNAELRGTDLVYRSYCDIGVAVGGGKGLAVPILRDAERLGLGAIERAIADFAARARQNRLELAELQGGTFTISNGGVYGSLLSTPIVNPPQSGILGLHTIQERPVARDGQVVIRSMMYVAVTYDHRVVDGREAVSFLTLIKARVEQPARLLLEI
jgi:2-oxoglutarate dehydrogenase E2 component (dihydrolipoamide succinyltransferase)